MNTLIGPQVAFVDDVESQIKPLEKALHKLNTGTVFFDARPDHTIFPTEPLETVKLLFLDLYYKGGGFDPALPAQWVQKIIAPNTKYTLVIWSMDTHETSNLMKVLAELELTPTHLEAWQKTDKEYKVENLPERIDQLINRISEENAIETDILFGEILDISDDGININCRLNEEMPTFQVRRFDKELLGSVQEIRPGMFVRICIYTKPGARLIDIFEEKKDLSELFEQPDFFKGLEGNAFFIEG